MPRSPRARRSRKAIALSAALIAPACGSTQHATTAVSPPPPALLAEARPIGRGPAFQPPPSGPVLGPCTPTLGPRTGVHVEVFAANRVVLIPAGIGTRAPRRYSSGRITRAGCYGQLVTLDPTGLVLVRPGASLEMGDLFRSWGRPLSAKLLLSFPVPRGTRIRVFVNGRRWRGSPPRVPLRPHAEIVLEVGPYVPPHAVYTFPPGT